MSIHHITSGDIGIIVSSHGAELISLKKGDKEYLYQKQEGFWQRQSPVLFPIVGALSGGAHLHEGEKYPMSQHGFARDGEFELVGQGEEYLRFRLCSDEQTLRQYPWVFTLEICYRIMDTVVRIEYTVRNRDEEMMYFSIGGHPAFMLDGAITEYSLLFSDDSTPDRWYLVGGLLDNYRTINVQKGVLPLSEELFADDALVFKNLSSREVILSHGTDRVLRIDRGNMPHFGVWRQTDTPFLCLEPWYGFASKSTDRVQQLSEKEGIVSLGAGEGRGFWWQISLGTTHNS